MPTLSLDPGIAETPHAAQQTIREWYQMYPDLVELRVNPTRLDGSIDTNYVIGKQGFLYHARSGKKGRPRMIDWNATSNAVMDQSLEHIRAITNDAIEAIHRFYALHPEYADLKIRPTTVNGHPSNVFYLGPNGRLRDVRTGRLAVVSFDSPEAINWIATRIRLERMYSDGESNSVDELAMMRQNDSAATTTLPVPPSAPPAPSPPPSLPHLPPSPPSTPRSLGIDDTLHLLEEDRYQADSENWVRE
jgi:hypothetical protein